MRTLAILVNLVLLVLAGRLMLGEDFEMNSTEEPLFLTLLAAPVISIIALLLRGAPNKDWLARYCERKALEERQKLEGMRPRPAQDGAAHRSQPVGPEANLMEHTVHQNSRPPAVTFAVVLLAVSLAIGFAIIVAAGANWANPLSYVVLTITVAVPALLIWFIFRGTNWARWVFLAQFALSLLLSPRCFQRLETYSGRYVISFCLLLVLELAAAVALCLPPTRQWFGGSTNAT